MHDLREVFEMVTKQTEPDLDSWKKQEDRQRQRSRNRRIGAIAVAAAAAIAIGAFALASRPGSGTTSVTNPPAPSVPFVTTPPIGAQLVAPDGTPVRQFPGSFSDASSLQLSPDGTTLAYIFADGSVHTVGINGSNDRTLTFGNTNQGDAQDHVVWSPDGSQLAYAFTGNIYVMNADGSGQHPITHSPGGIGYYHPVWSSDGTIAFWGGSPTGEDGGPPDAEIYTVSATGGPVSRLTHDAIHDIEPAWSPDASKIAYWHDGALWIMRANGAHQHEVSAAPDGGAWAPAWSPDGTQIAFIAYVGNLSAEKGGSPVMAVRTVEVRTGRIHSLGMHVLTDNNGPQWFSDGEILINRYN